MRCTLAVALLLAATSCAPPPRPPPSSRSDLAADALGPALRALAQEDINQARQRLQKLRHHTSAAVRRDAEALLAIVTLWEEATTRASRLHADAQDLRRRLEAIERALADAQSSLDEHTVVMRHLQEERSRLKEQLDETQATVKRLETAKTDLQSKLDALKKIDLGED